MSMIESDEKSTIYPRLKDLRVQVFFRNDKEEADVDTKFELKKVIESCDLVLDSTISEIFGRMPEECKDITGFFEVLEYILALFSGQLKERKKEEEAIEKLKTESCVSHWIMQEGDIIQIGQDFFRVSEMGFKKAVSIKKE